MRKFWKYTCKQWNRIDCVLTKIHHFHISAFLSFSFFFYFFFLSPSPSDPFPFNKTLLFSSPDEWIDSKKLFNFSLLFLCTFSLSLPRTAIHLHHFLSLLIIRSQESSFSFFFSKKLFFIYIYLNHVTNS